LITFAISANKHLKTRESVKKPFNNVQSFGEEQTFHVQSLAKQKAVKLFLRKGFKVPAASNRSVKT